MRVLTACVWVALQAAVPETQLVERVRQHMTEVLSHLPDYTCRQTIARAVRAGPQRPFMPVDTLRVEVSFVGGKELFAWPGAARFEDQSIGDLIGGGTIGTGSFALHMHAVFLDRLPVYAYAGEGVVDGRAALRFDLRMPRERKKYLVQVDGREATVGYHGSFWVDAGTFDLIRMELTADEIPAEMGLRQVTETMEYARQAIGSSEFLLPRSSELVITGTSGVERRNTLRFDACRHYAGESLIRYSAEAGAPAPATPPVETGALPEGTVIEAILDGLIDVAAGAVGDPVSATVPKEVKRGGRVLAPKGARIEGRISLLQRGATQSGSFTAIGLRVFTLRAEGMERPLRARLEAVTIPGMGRSVVLLDPAGGRAGPQRAAASANAAPRPSDGLFLVWGRDSRQVRRVHMIWRVRNVSGPRP